MKIFIVSLFFAFSLLACAQQQPGALAIPLGDAKAPVGKEAVANFAEGCFWHAEIVFQSLNGVRDAVSGYAGGKDPHPNYEKVASGETGHAETVQVYYDPTKISYETLVAAFFASQDPTTLNRQGNDEGTEYRSIAFYRNDTEKQIIEKTIQQLTAAKKYSSKIVTEVVPFTQFYPAEDYHQNYYEQNKGQSYCGYVITPKVEKVRTKFKDKLKK